MITESPAGTAFSVILDTETTGLDPNRDRLVEVAAIELNGISTGQIFHSYFNPGVKMNKEAERIHGLSDEFLKDKPAFRDRAADLISFISGKELIIHNAEFDIGFLNAELFRAGLGKISNPYQCSLKLARSKLKGPHNLDALCRRFNIDISKRTKHDAILDCQLLAKVWVELNGGLQPAFDLKIAEKKIEEYIVPARPVALPGRLSQEERSAFMDMLKESGRMMWKDLVKF